MASFTTGETLLPDVGALEYQGCTFGPLFATTVNGNVVRDEAGRTTKLMEYTLIADGYVTLPLGQADIGSAMDQLRALLSQQGGRLKYTGRGLNLEIDAVGSSRNVDVAWGPIPQLIEFQPLGAGRSAKVQWKVVVRIPEIARGTFALSRGKPVLQFNYETSVSYAEDGYATVSVRGTLEIPLARWPAQTSRTLLITADNYRSAVDTQIMSGFDLNRFSPSKRDNRTSRDKRTLTWDYEFVEKPYMDLPVNCSIASGSFNVRTKKASPGLVQWFCTLKVTYTVRRDADRRWAWVSFLALLWLRMAYSRTGELIGINEPPSQRTAPRLKADLNANPIYFVADVLPPSRRKATLWDFAIDEGLYRDSKTISFQAVWSLTCTFDTLISACGLWRRLPQQDINGRPVWSTTMRDVSGTTSWLRSELDPALDLIVDFGV